MTETDWLSCRDPARMIPPVRRKVSRRKWRLFVCACCRRQWDDLTDPRSRAAVEAGEQHADGALSAKRCKAAREAARAAAETEPGQCGALPTAAEMAAGFPILPDSA